jgi:hypothetical protein
MCVVRELNQLVLEYGLPNKRGRRFRGIKE